MNGRLAVVTGASRGLGRAIALELSARGARVVVHYRVRAEDAEAVVAEIASRGGESFAAAFDVANPDAVDAGFRAIRSRAGDVEILVNNAGIYAETLFGLSQPAEEAAVLAVNLAGAMHCSRAVVRRMIALRRGAIVNVASGTALRPRPGNSAYAASKGGLLAFSRALALELAPKGIRVNAVIPGFFDAGIARRLGHGAQDEAAAAIPLGRVGTGEELARAVAFLASDQASYVVGAELVVDGGATL